MADNNNVASKIAPLAAGGTGLGLTALGAVGGPVGMAIGAGVGALLSAVGAIGSGRRTANKMTGEGSPQDILNKQLALISANYGADPDEAKQATQLAWSQFLQAANEFASQGPEYAQVAKQAIFQTPGLTDTVKSLGGFDPLSSEFTSTLAPSIPKATPQSGLSVGNLIGSTAAGVGGALGGSYLHNLITGAPEAAGTMADGGPTFGPDVPPDVTSGVDGAGGAGNAASSSILNQIFGKNPVSSLLGVGTSVLNGVLQSSAAKSAAGIQSKSANDALDFAKQVYGDQKAANAPFLAAGTNALDTIQKLIAPGGDLSKPFVAPTAEEVKATPGYQLQLDAALKALGNQTKGITSGATVKAAERYAGDYADTKYNEALGSAENIYQLNRTNTLQPLLTLAGFGPGAVSANNQSGNNIAAENANLGTEAGAAQAAGVTGSTNAITNSLTNVSNNLQGNNTLAQVLALLNRPNASANRQSSVYA